MKFWVGITIFIGFLWPAQTTLAALPILRLGDFSETVTILQKALNQDQQTQVAQSGAGAAGLETDYFGPKTHAAVIRFQQKYAAEILTPLGLTVPTGVVGPRTWAVIERLRVVEPPPTAAKLFKIEPKTIRQSSIVTLSGLYFSATNTLVFDGKQLVTVAAESPSTLTVQLPTSLSVGNHTLALHNGKATSSILHFSIVPAPTSTARSAPIIYSVDPVRVAENAVVTIYGEHFEATGNTVYTGYAELSNIPSPDGKTIRITLSTPFHAVAQAAQFEIPLWFFVETDAGVSNEAVITYVP